MFTKLVRRFLKASLEKDDLRGVHALLPRWYKESRRLKHCSIIFRICGKLRPVYVAAVKEL